MTENLNATIFYSLEKGIRTYRQFAQKRINEKGFDITIDQWMLLKAMEENLELSQHELAGKTLKDHASVTRMIELMVKKKFLRRTTHAEDRRRFQLTITKSGTYLLVALQPLIEENRRVALKGISSVQISKLREVMDTLISNLQPEIL